MREESGRQSAPSPPDDADAFEAMMFLVDFQISDFTRTRRIAKHRAARVVWITSLFSGFIAVAGVAVAIWHYPWIGFITTGLAGATGTLAAWDGLFRHRELWYQRSGALSQLEQLKRNMELDLRLKEKDRGTIAKEASETLDLVLAESFSAWAEMRRKQDPK